MAYFRYRIELNRKGLELTVPKRVAIVEKNGKVSKTHLMMNCIVGRKVPILKPSS